MILTADAGWNWSARLPESHPELCHWLQDTGSLTERLRLCCRHFRVQLQRTRAQVSLTPEQADWLGVEQAHCREVLLLCDQQPWIYASSLYSASASDAVPALGGLGQRALGELLFEDPRLTRSDFEFARLTASQWQQWVQQQGAGQETPGMSLSSMCPQTFAPAALPWARRSLLAIPQASVLVTELFLPAARVYRE